MKKMLLMQLMVFVSLHANDSIPLTWATLLGTLTQDAKLQANTERIQVMKNAPGPGIWDELELRYELNGFDFREHKLDVRISPFGFGEGSANQAAWKSRIESNEVQGKKILNRVLHERYQLGVQWLYKKMQLDFHQNLFRVYQDRIQVHISLSTTDRFDPEDLVNSEQRAAELEGEILSDQSEIAECEHLLHVLIPEWTDIRLDTVELITASEIKKRLSAIPQVVDSSYPDYRIAQARVRMAEQKFQLEKASSLNVVSYVNVGYAWQIPETGKQDKTSLLEDLNAGFGIRIPFGNGRTQDQLERQIDVLDEKSSLLETQGAIAERMSQLSRTVGSIVHQISVQDSFRARVNTGALFTDYAMRAGTDPLLLLKARAASLQTAWQAKKLWFDAVLVYLEILKVAGVLANDPGTNHLKGLKKP